MVALLVVSRAVAAQVSERGALEAGLQSFTEGRFGEAERYLRQAVAAQPRLFDARLALGATLAQLSRSREAIEQLEAAHRLKPDHVDALKLLAAQYMVQRDYRKAIALLAPLPSADEEVYLLLIESYQVSGDAARSFALARKAAARFPSSARINCWMGFQLQFSGRYEDARVYLERALHLDPNDPAPYYVLADVLLKEQRFEESIRHFQRAIDLDPGDVDARVGLSQAWVGAGDLSRALKVLEDAGQASPEDARVHVQLSRLYFRMGDKARAEREADLSLRLRSGKSGAGELPLVLRSGH